MALPSVNVLCPGPVSPSSPILLPANHPLVAATHFLEWQPAAAAAGGAAQVALPTASAAVAFLVRNRVDAANAADKAAARGIHYLNFRLSGAAWTEYLSELVDSGLLGCSLVDTPGLHQAIAGLTLTDPTRLHYRAAHWAPGAALAMPAGGGAAAVARRAALEQLRFLSLVSVLALESATDTLASKLTVFLVGLMGDCRTDDAARTDKMADCQVAAAALRGMFAANAAAGTMARELKDYILKNTLPDVYLSLTADPDTLRAQLRDGITYHSSRAGRAQVERSRILSTTARVRCSHHSQGRMCTYTCTPARYVH